MYPYIKKSMWFPQHCDFGEAATIEALLELCKAGEVERVIIPMTYYGYGASLIDDSNFRSIQRHYKANKLKTHGMALTMSAWQFVHNEELRELVDSLTEYAVFDEQDHSMLESETKLEFLVDEISYVLTDDESLLEVLPETLYETKDVVRDALESGDWQTNIEWWEYVEIDNDGATPYAEKKDIAALVVLVKAKIEAETDTK